MCNQQGERNDGENRRRASRGWCLKLASPGSVSSAVRRVRAQNHVAGPVLNQPSHSSYKCFAPLIRARHSVSVTQRNDCTLACVSSAGGSWGSCSREEKGPWAACSCHFKPRGHVPSAGPLSHHRRLSLPFGATHSHLAGLGDLLKFGFSVSALIPCICNIRVPFLCYLTSIEVITEEVERLGNWGCLGHAR